MACCLGARSDTKFTTLNSYFDSSARLDKALAEASGLSRERAKTLLTAGHVQVDGMVASSPSAKARPGSTFQIEIPPASEPVAKPQDIPLEVVFADEHLIVINKPAGMVVHPAAGNWTGTLVNALIARCGDSLSGIGGVRRPGIVHRLDKNTSGLLVVAKSDRAHQGLTAQFADHGRSGPLRRAYKALVWGAMTVSNKRIEAPIGRAFSVSA